jgi:hypothetical protein
MAIILSLNTYCSAQKTRICLPNYNTITTLCWTNLLSIFTLPKICSIYPLFPSIPPTATIVLSIPVNLIDPIVPLRLIQLISITTSMSLVGMSKTNHKFSLLESLIVKSYQLFRPNREVFYPKVIFLHLHRKLPNV